MYKVAICDDEKIFAEFTKSMIEKIVAEDEIEISVTLYSDADALVQDLKNDGKLFNLILFDVRLGEENGIDVACKIKHVIPNIDFIFITSFSEYAIDGYEAEASGFLVKPIDEGKLKSAFFRAYNKHQHKNIVIKSKNEIHTIDISNILYIEVYGKILTFHLKGGQKIDIRKTLSEVITLLPKGEFVQCHRSYIVVIDEIRSIERYEIILSNGAKIPVSKLRYTDIQKALIKNISTRNI